jgi:hypothetical protein
MRLLMNNSLLVPLVILIVALPQTVRAEGGITPEQIFQPAVKSASLVGTWEVLPEETPLAEQEEREPKVRPRTLLALRKDFTCRIFNENHPAGSDGLWTFENHELFITLPSSAKVEFYVYGIKGDFMMTRSPIKEGKDQLWSRVK